MTCTVQWEINRTIELNVDPDGIHAPDVNRGGEQNGKVDQRPHNNNGGNCGCSQSILLFLLP